VEHYIHWNASQSGPNFSGHSQSGHKFWGQNRYKKITIPAPSFPAHNKSLWFGDGNRKISIWRDIDHVGDEMHLKNDWGISFRTTITIYGGNLTNYG
jgi:hypothetical protein